MKYKKLVNEVMTLVNKRSYIKDNFSDMMKLISKYFYIKNNLVVI